MVEIGRKSDFSHIRTKGSEMEILGVYRTSDNQYILVYEDESGLPRIEGTDLLKIDIDEQGTMIQEIMDKRT